MQIEELPCEILVHIFSYLSSRDLARSASVCFEWSVFSRDEFLWKYLCLGSWGYLNATQKRLRAPIETTWLSYYKRNLDKKNLKFLVLGAEGGGHKDERLADVKTKLVASGLANVDVFNARIATPTLEQLTSYSSVLFFSYHGFDQIAVGNLLTQYVDLGGGVVLGSYANCGRGNRLEGKWANGYDPILVGSTAREKNLTVGKMLKDNHPIMKNVNSVTGGGQGSHGDGAVHSEAEVIVEWSNGRPLVVELKKHSGVIVSLNMYPPSSDVADGCWAASSDGGVLMANALYHATFSNRI